MTISNERKQIFIVWKESGGKGRDKNIPAMVQSLFVNMGNKNSETIISKVIWTMFLNLLFL